MNRRTLCSLVAAGAFAPALPASAAASPSLNPAQRATLNGYLSALGRPATPTPSNC